MFILYLWNWNEGQFTFYIWLSRLSGQQTETETEGEWDGNKIFAVNSKERQRAIESAVISIMCYARDAQLLQWTLAGVNDFREYSYKYKLKFNKYLAYSLQKVTKSDSWVEESYIWSTYNREKER